MNKNLTIHCDGGSRGNPGPAAYGFVVLDDKNNVICEIGEYLGKNTNNHAEYLSLISALKWIEKYSKDNDLDSVDIKMDSELVVKQIGGVYKVKSSNLIPLYTLAKGLLNKMDDIKIKIYHVKRGENFSADAVVNQVLDDKTM